MSREINTFHRHPSLPACIGLHLPKSSRYLDRGISTAAQNGQEEGHVAVLRCSCCVTLR